VQGGQLRHWFGAAVFEPHIRRASLRRVVGTVLMSDPKAIDSSNKEKCISRLLSSQSVCKIVHGKRVPPGRSLGGTRTRRVSCC
jgi:hypothetical protein